MGIFSRFTSARKPQGRGRKQAARAQLLPDHVQSFIAQRLTDMAALGTAAVGLAVAVSLATYNLQDPSLNSAGNAEGKVENMLGLGGAYTADILLQTLGLAAYIIAGAFMVWGYRIFKRKHVGNILNRLPLILLASLVAAIALARIPAFESWGIGAYMGGSAGALIFNAISNHLQGALGATAFVFVAVTAIAIFIPLMIAGLGISLGEWKNGITVTGGVSRFVLQKILQMLVAFRTWHRTYTEQQEEISKPVIRRKTVKFDRDTAPEVAAEEEEYEEEEDDEEYEVEDEDEDEDDEEEEAVAKPIPFARKKPIVTKRNEVQKSTREEKQKKLNLKTRDDEWELPSLDFLGDAPAANANNRMDEASLQKNAELLQATLNDFGVQGDISKVNPGPIVTLYEMEPAPGTKTSRVIGLADDIARSMSAVSVRVAVVAGKNAIGIELPNAKREMVILKELLATKDYDKTTTKLPLVLGKNIGGDPIIADLARMPHLLVAGTTGSGKSVAVNTMILSLLYKLSPEQCRFIMIDPKMLELSVYDDIPHLLTPVVTEAHRAVIALKWAVREMEDRYRAMSKLGVRNIDGFNERVRGAKASGEVLMHKIQTGFDSDTGKPVYEEQPLPLNDLPYIVIIVDEFADLMLVAGKEVENAIQRLAQMARAAGIHLIMATQRPSVDVITGVIKANFPTRISFQVTSKIDSRTILGEGGAETLLGQGDMLYMASGGRIARVHGPFVADNEVEKIVKFLKSQGTPNYIDGVTDDEEEQSLFGEDGESAGGGGDELYDKAVAVVLRERKVSTSFIQRHLQIGYNRAARIVERMEKEGLITAANHVGKRDILVDNYGT